ncbi:hypothetical protein G3T16_17010 [Kineobactrum salinum]|uniref:2-oxoacid dehydrogenase acyltransferase catalytic domain-containing protein n=1 Tax=Kineobactrum salinum TaxID=2708301 RepID=A0A6C0U3W2_9GAMM|nr:hypothetical protein G3T16_17010 [Kineobactrum salinum]
MATALREYPRFNTSLAEDGGTVLWKSYVNVGVAVDTAEGLVVPVIRDPSSQGIDSLADEISRLAEKARGKGLSMQDMSGGCFTISSIGHVGGTGFTPIINLPEVAILGISRARDRLVPSVAGSPLTRRFLPLSLSYDHRVINGVEAAAFLTRVAGDLATFEF